MVFAQLMLFLLLGTTLCPVSGAAENHSIKRYYSGSIKHSCHADEFYRFSDFGVLTIEGDQVIFEYLFSHGYQPEIYHFSGRLKNHQVNLTSNSNDPFIKGISFTAKIDCNKSECKVLAKPQFDSVLTKGLDDQKRKKLSGLFDGASFSTLGIEVNASECIHRKISDTDLKKAICPFSYGPYKNIPCRTVIGVSN